MKRTTEMIDENWLGYALQTQPEIAETLAYAYGPDYPLSFLTQGSGRIAENYKMVSSSEFDWHLMGDFFKSIPIKGLVGTHEKPGISHSRFQVTFPEKYFALGDLIRFGSGTIARVQEDPVAGSATEWIYTLQINGRDSTEYVPATDIAAGERVSIAGNAFEEASEGGSSKTASPMRLRNQMGITRWQYSMTGSAQATAMVYGIKGEDGTVHKLWQPIQEYHQSKMFHRLNEYMRWYSKGNREADGQISLHGANGRVVRTYDGVTEQIAKSNRREYTYLTESYLQDMLIDLVRKQSGAENKKLIMFTGAGGKKQFHNALKQAASSYTLVDTTLIHKKTKESLKYGSYFTEYKGLLGTDLVVVHNPLQDDDTLFPKLHPVDKLPLESYNMYFLDFSDYGGESNISLVARGAGGVNRSFLQWYTAGGATPDISSGVGVSKVMRSHGKDAFDCHSLSESSVKVVNPLACGSLIYSSV